MKPEPGIRLTDLQLAVLSTLRGATQPSVTTLARAINVPRPSVSRSLGPLLTAGLILRSGRQLRITNLGLRVCDTAQLIRNQQRRLAPALEGYRDALRVVEALGPTTQELNRISHMMDEIARPTREMFEQFRTLESIPSVNRLAEVGRLITDSIKPSIRDISDDFRAPLFELDFGGMDRLNNEILRQSQQASRLFTTDFLKSICALNDVTAAYSVRLSEVANGLTAVRTVTDWVLAMEANQAALAAVARLGSLPSLIARFEFDFVESLASITGSFQQVIQHLEPHSGADLPLAGSVATAEFAIFTLRSASDEPAREQFSISGPETAVGVQVEARLETVDVHLVQMRRGAWAALRSQNPDNVRQAAHSMRELLRQLLTVLAPDREFTKEHIAKEGYQGRITRKMRIRRIAGGHPGRFAAILDKSLDEAYDVLSDKAHTGDDDVALLAGIMAATEGLVAILFAAGPLQ